MKSKGLAVVFAALCLFVTAGANASFIDITSVTPNTGAPGSSSSFMGTVDGVGVSASTTVTGVGGIFGFTTTDGTSPQFSYASSFSQTQALGDAIGYIVVADSVVEWTINFAAPVKNLVFHLAELDGSTIDFTSQGLAASDLSILNSNGNLGLNGVEILGGASVGFPVDADPISAASGYGSVALSGVFTSLTFTQEEFRSFGDGGRFQFTAEAVPVPATAWLISLGLAGLGFTRRKKA